MPALACPWYPVEAVDSVEVRRGFREFARLGPLRHWQASILHVVAAAVAARTGLTVGHYDQDYDVIAAVTGLPTWWAAARGSP